MLMCCTVCLSQGLADNAVISRVNGELWDLDRPLEGDCSLEVLRFDNEDAQAVSIESQRRPIIPPGVSAISPSNRFQNSWVLTSQVGVSTLRYGG